MATKELDFHKTYDLSQEICIVKYEDNNLVIAVETAKWIVLTDSQLLVFKELKNGKTIEEVFSIFSDDDVVGTLVQLEARQFEDKEPKLKEENNLCIYLTNRCNLRCKHCYMYSGEKEIEELDTEEWKKILNSFKQCGGENVTFTGGEVTLRKDLLSILAYSKQIGLNNTVLSNGVLWNDETIESAYKNIDEIQISIDGYDDTSNAITRGSGSFEKAITTVKKFYEKDTKVSIAVTPLYDNIDKFVENFIPFATSFIETYPNIFIKVNLELIKGRDVNLTEDENKDYKKQLMNLVNTIYPDYYINNFVINYKDNTILNSCGFGEMTIAPNGDIYFCNRIHELNSIYNVKNDDFEKLFNQTKLVREKTSVDNVEPCKTCEIKYICGGGCRLKYKNIEQM